MTLCVYAIAAAAGAGRVASRSSSSVRVVRAGPLAAFAAERRRPPRATPANLRRHHRAIEGLRVAVPAVIPVRFGTCTTDAAELAMILRSRQAFFQRMLRHLRGHVQMTVRVPVAAGPRATHAGVGTTGRGRVARTSRARSGTEYLRARAQAAAEARHVPEFESVRTAVARWLREERVEKQTRTTHIYHLVPRRSVDAYRRVMEERCRAAGLRAVISGPFAPYAFCDE